VGCICISTALHLYFLCELLLAALRLVAVDIRSIRRWPEFAVAFPQLESTSISCKMPTASYHSRTSTDSHVGGTSGATTSYGQVIEYIAGRYITRLSCFLELQIDLGYSQIDFTLLLTLIHLTRTHPFHIIRNHHHHPKGQHAQTQELL
jgi:hypothetical protein